MMNFESKKDVPSCQYNVAVACEDYVKELQKKGTTKCCEHCGWNPEEWAERVLKLKGVQTNG